MKAKPLSATTSKLYVGPLFANLFQEVFGVSLQLKKVHEMEGFPWKGDENTKCVKSPHKSLVQLTSC